MNAEDIAVEDLLEAVKNCSKEATEEVLREYKKILDS